ncbi:unnamed protein product [Diplocarpon coronariae]|nr:hypothetical protein JHW43_000245 [Diplocarpon mali]
MPPRTVPLHYRVLCGDPNGESTRDFIFYERIPTRLTNETDDPQTPKSNNILKTFLSQLENLHAEEMLRSQPWQCAFCSGPAVKFEFSGVARLGSAIPTVSVIGVPCCFYEACLQKVGTISGPYLSRLSGVVSPETLLKSLTPCEKCGPVAHATLCRDYTAAKRVKSMIGFVTNPSAGKSEMEKKKHPQRMTSNFETGGLKYPPSKRTHRSKQRFPKVKAAFREIVYFGA